MKTTVQIPAKILKELAKVAAKPSHNRDHLEMIRADSHKGKLRLWATNGHCLISRIFEGIDYEGAGHSYQLGPIKKLKNADVLTWENGGLFDDRGALPCLHDSAVSCPDIDQVIPEQIESFDKPGTRTLSLNPKLISLVISVCERIGDHQGIAGRLQIGADDLAPVRFDYGSALGVIMPCRAD